MASIKINITQQFIAGGILNKIIETTENQIDNEKDKDTKRALQYLVHQLNKINDEISKNLACCMANEINRARKIILGVDD